MKYLSVCSGIEAASVAWQPLGWEPLAFAEIEPFPCSVLSHRYADVPNLGDLTRYADWPRLDADLLVGGTPCQSFSVAGLRKGMADPRGNLALVFLGLVDCVRPRWVVWENVPGVLSSNAGRDFGAFLGALGELGYGWAYRILDSQYFGLAQRRRRVFVVAHLGDWRPPVAVLFESDSLCGDSAPRRETGENATHSLAARTRSGSGYGPDPETPVIPWLPDVSPAMKARDAKCPSSDGDGDGLPLIPMTTRTLRADGFDAGEDGTGRGTPLVPMVVETLTSNGDAHSGFRDEHGLVPMALAQPLRAGRQFSDMGDGQSNVVSWPIDMRQASRGEKLTNNRAHGSGGAPGHGIGNAGDPAYTVSGRGQAIAFGGQMSTPQVDFDLSQTLGRKNPQAVAASSVRRLTPVECERLQGFLDNWTLVPHRGKPAADGPRYKALGNSMAVPVVRWIGERIDLISAIALEAAA